MRELPAMRKLEFLKFVASQMQQRELLLFSEKPEIFLDKTFLDKTINNAILRRDLFDWIHKKRPQAHIEIGDIEALFGQRQAHRYDVIVANHSDDKGGLLANLINRCAIYSTFVFVFGVKKEKVEAIAPKTLEDLYAVVQTDEQFVCIEPKLFFVSKMVAYSYFNEVPYKRLFSCVISHEKLEKMVFCEKAAKIAKDKMVVGLIKDNLDKLERTDGFVDKDLNFCVLGIPNRNIQWQQLSLDSQFDVGTIVDISHTSRKVLDEDQVDKWGNSALLPKVLIPYLHELLKHSAKEILGILEIGNGEGIYSKEIYGGQYSLFSITVGQYIPSQKGCCTFACYYLDRLDSSALRIKNTATALYAQLSSFILEDARNRFLSKSVQTAIGSIMSRNGSHNIGSHVLAALSHNVGTMPDDQVLYQYIQHRMDYIATATTDRPTWTQPTMFVGDMMKRFLSQRHLLNYICRSEDLSAWEFQSDKAKKISSGGKIKFHVRKLRSDGNYIDFINYDAPKQTIGLKDDASLAIPGGVVGQHAFFTIIENIVRNAAKHDWTTPPKSTAVLKDPDQTDSNPKGNLDVYIDFEDKPEDENVHFTIWTRLSDVFENVKPTDARKKEATEADLKQWKTLGDLSTLPLHHRQHVKLVKSFIDASGGLRREDWGLAEMKISAGYLQKASIDDIGGISSSFGYDIIRPCCVTDKEAVVGLELKKPGQHASRDEKREIKEYNARIKALGNVCHLGYRFDVPKAKKMLFVVSKVTDKLKTQEIPLRQKGIYIKAFDEIKDLQESKTLKEKGLAYQYVILDEFLEAQKKWMLPFRVLVAKEALSELSSLVPRLTIKRSNEERTFDSTLGYLEFIIGENSAIGRKSATAGEEGLYGAIANDICACWARHLIKHKRIKAENGRGYIKEGLGARDVSLVVSTSGGDSGAGKSLASMEDVVEFALNEGLDTALTTYKTTCKPEENGGICDKIIARLKALKGQGDLVYSRTNDLNKERKELIKQQLAAWLEIKVSDSDGNDGDLKEAIVYLKGTSVKGTSAELQKLQKQLKEANEKYNVTKGDEQAFWLRTYLDIDAKIKSAKSVSGDFEDSKNKKLIDHLVEYIESYCDQIKNLLSKYAEKIATLPGGFSIEGKNKWKNGWEDAGILPFKSNSEKIFNLRYWRHQTNKNERYDYYLEPLSGTQSYLSSLDAIKGGEYTLLSNLVENALFRILIIDERTREFLEKHIAQKQTFNNMGIYVANDGKVAKDMEAKASGKKIKSGSSEFSTEGFVNIDANTVCEVSKWYAPGGAVDKKKRQELIDKAKKRFYNKYDALIIHQGIIDKWLPGAAHSQEKVEKFIEGLKQVFKYVVITTGRGTPANIPDSARVLPFSTIQTTLFKQYPEKLILTDAIMNILPVRSGNGGN